MSATPLIPLRRCRVCEETGFDEYGDECSCCRGRRKVALVDVADEDLAYFRAEPDCDAEVVRRGFVAWAVDCTGEILPCTAEDVANGCELVRWVTGPGVARASAPVEVLSKAG